MKIKSGLMAKKVLLLTIVAVCTISCKEVQSFTRTIQESQYLGNAFEEMKGYTENQILRQMSSPTRIESDGANGKILVYEERQTKTDANSSYTIQSRTSAGSTTTVGQNIWTGAPQANTNASASTTTHHNTAQQSVTYEEKTFINFFINPEGICYDVVTNTGDIYSDAITEKVCYKVPKTLDPAVMWTLIPPLTILVGVPLTIAYFACEKKRANWRPSEKDLVECE